MKRVLYPGIVCLAAALVSPVVARGATATVSGDAYISQSNAANNFGAVGTMNVSSANSALIQFDLTALQALGLTNANIQKAYLTVFVNRVLVAGGLDFALTNQAWSELAATYNNFNQGLIGAPFASNVPVQQSTVFVKIDVTDQVRDWLTGAVINNGIIVKAAVAQPSTSAVLDSKESTTTSEPAFLDILLTGSGSGPTGATGPSGPAGATGATGPAGPAGGPSGPSGPIGAVGATGPSGPAGLAGAAGPSGPSGPIGAVGASGPSGPSGVAGAAGASGPSGPIGAVGASGPSGPSGVAGAAGASGPSGPAGVQGIPGSQGPSGPSGTAAAQQFASAVGTISTTGAYSWTLNSSTALSASNLAETLVEAPVSASCTFDRLDVRLVTSNAPSSPYNLTVELYKGGVASGVKCSVSVSTANTAASCSDVAHTLAVAAGETLALTATTSPGVSYNNGRIAASLHCK